MRRAVKDLLILLLCCLGGVVVAKVAGQAFGNAVFELVAWPFGSAIGYATYVAFQAQTEINALRRRVYELESRGVQIRTDRV